jgi:hypothetical protein
MLTSFGDDTANPRAVVVHLFHTSLNLAAMMRPVGFPIAAGAAPAWPPVRLAHEHILAVELLEPGTVGIVVGPGLISQAGFDVPSSTTSSSRFGLVFGRSRPKIGHSGVELDNEVHSRVCQEDQKKEDGI